MISSARLPQWASDLAARAPVLPEGVPEDDFLTVLQEQDITGRLRVDGRSPLAVGDGHCPISGLDTAACCAWDRSGCSSKIPSGW